MISLKSRPKRREDLQQRDLEDGCVLYDPKKEMTYTLNLTASLIWSYLDGDVSLEQIAEETASLSGVHRDEVVKDVFKTVASFQENGLVEPESV